MLSLQPKQRGIEQQVARRAHNPKVTGSSPVPATKKSHSATSGFFYGKYPKVSMQAVSL